MTTEVKIWQDLVRYDMVRLSKIWLDMKKVRLGKIRQDMTR